MASKLTERLLAARTDMRRQRQILSRARRLYVAICRRAIHEDLSGQKLEFCAGRMLDSGMYAECVSRTQALHDVRYAILRRMWRMDGSPGSWHAWTLKNGWVAHTWRRMLWQREIA